MYENTIDCICDQIDTACVEVGYLSMQTVFFDIYITSAK